MKVLKYRLKFLIKYFVFEFKIWVEVLNFKFKVLHKS